MRRLYSHPFDRATGLRHSLLHNVHYDTDRLRKFKDSLAIPCLRDCRGFVLCYISPDRVSPSANPKFTDSRPVSAAARRLVEAVGVIGCLDSGQRTENHSRRCAATAVRPGRPGTRHLRDGPPSRGAPGKDLEPDRGGQPVLPVRTRGIHPPFSQRCEKGLRMRRDRPNHPAGGPCPN